MDSSHLLSNYDSVRIEDPEVLLTFEEIQSTTGKLLKVRELTLLNLNTLKEDIEKRYDETRKAKVAGSIFSVTGSVIGIIGFGLNFVPDDIPSWVLALLSGVIFLIGGLILMSADIFYFVESRTKLNDAVKACCNDCELMKDLEPLGGKFKELYEQQDDWCKKISF